MLGVSQYVQQDVVEALLKELEAPGPPGAWGGALQTQQPQQQGRRKDSVVTSLRYTPLTQNAPQQQQQQRAGQGVNGLGVNQRGGGASPAMWHSIPPAQQQQQQPVSATAGTAVAFAGFGGFGSPMGTPMAITPSPLQAIAVGNRQQQLQSAAQMAAERSMEHGNVLSSVQPGTMAGGTVYGANGGRQSERWAYCLAEKVSGVPIFHCPGVFYAPLACPPGYIPPPLLTSALSCFRRPSPSGTDDMMMDEDTATPMPSNAFPSEGGGGRMEQSIARMASVPVQREQLLTGGDAPSCSAAGCGLAGNADVMTCRADLLFTRCVYVRVEAQKAQRSDSVY